MIENCTDINGFEISQFIFNEDGTVSGIVNSSSSPNNDLSTTYENVQKTLYKSELNSTPISKECCDAFNFTWNNNENKCYWVKTCETNSFFKLSLGIEENDGVIFTKDENETCFLNIEFDYLIQFSCDSLLNCISNEENIVDEEVEILNDEFNKNSDIIDTLNDEFNGIIEKYTLSLNDLNNKLRTVSCDEYDTNINNINKELLTATSKIVQQNLLAELNNQTLKKRECLTYRENLSRQINDIELNITQTNNNYANVISQYEDENSNIVNKINQFSEKSLQSENFNNCLDIFSNLDIDFTLDVISVLNNDDIIYENASTLITVYEDKLYHEPNIVDYWTNNCNTGLLVTGDTICLKILDNCIKTSLSGDCGVYSACTLNSDWKHYQTIISDEVILSAITDEKIKIGFKINGCNCDINLLIDNIKINKNCSKLDNSDLFITKCPEFNFERVIDNKKSWIAEDNYQERDYDLSLRETEYDVNHHKLVLNTKEIELNICPATAIETDLWCYINDNKSLLDCSTGTTYMLVNNNPDFNGILLQSLSECSEDFSCTCQDGFIYNEVTGNCEKLDQVEPTFNGDNEEVLRSTSTAYGGFGARFYTPLNNNQYPVTEITTGYVDVNSNVIPVIHTATGFWQNTTGSNGFLNSVGVWNNLIPYNEWVGLDFCYDSPVKKRITIALSADDCFKVVLNGQLLISAEVNNVLSHGFCHLFEIEIEAGVNNFGISGKNYGSAGSYGFALYDAPINQIIPITNPSDLIPLYIEVSDQFLSTNFTSGISVGYSCPAGYYLNNCEELICEKLESYPCPQKNCDINVIWNINVTLDCKEIYNNDFFVSTGVTSVPTQIDYINQLTIISNLLGLDLINNSDESIFIYDIDCEGINLLNKNIKIDLGLDIFMDCNTKQFQDLEIFQFQNGDNYNFNE